MFRSVIRHRSTWATAVGGLLLSLSAPARAQTATPLERLEPAPAGDDLFSVQNTNVAGELRPSAAFTLSYAHSPLVVAGDVGGERKIISNIVSYQLTLHTLVSIELAKRF